MVAGTFIFGDPGCKGGDGEVAFPPVLSEGNPYTLDRLTKDMASLSKEVKELRNELDDLRQTHPVPIEPESEISRGTTGMHTPDSTDSERTQDQKHGNPPFQAEGSSRGGDERRTAQVSPVDNSRKPETPYIPNEPTPSRPVPPRPSKKLFAAIERYQNAYITYTCNWKARDDSAALLAMMEKISPNDGPKPEKVEKLKQTVAYRTKNIVEGAWELQLHQSRILEIIQEEQCRTSTC